MILIKFIMITMKKLRLLIVSLLFLLLLTPVVLYADSRALTHFSMGYYYLYNDELESSLDQFELSLLFE